MKTLFKRLAALNLVWIMLLSMLPFTAGAASGYYVHHIYYPASGKTDTVYSSYLNLDYAPYLGGRYSLIGWSLEEGGMPVTDESEVPSADSGDVNLYSVAAYTVSLPEPYDAENYVYYAAGPIMIGNVQADVSGSSGTGWTYANGKLYLNSEYPGDPITAASDLVIYTEGDVTVTGSGGPAIRSLTGSVHFRSMFDTDSLTLVGDNAPAIVSNSLVYLENPSNLELSATGGYPVSTRKIVYETAAVAEHKLLVNRSFMGEDKASATETDSINIYDPHPSSGSTLRTYQSYVRFEGIDKADLQLGFSLDTNGGEPLDTDSVTAGGSGLDFSTFASADIILPQISEPQLSGHIFTGWQLNGDDSYTYFPGEPVTTGSRGNRLSAVWTEAPADDYIVFNGNGNALSSPQMDRTVTDALPLEGGTICIPENNASGFVGWYTEKLSLPDLSKTDFFEGLYFPGQTVSLPSGTTLYAVYYNRNTAVIHGNGQLTEAGNDRILVMAGQLQLTPGSLYVYSKAADAQEKGFFSAEGKALLDYNTAPDGSGEYNGVAGCDAYAQWVDAPAGSVLLYSYTPATAGGRYGKLLTPAEAAAFDPTNAYGFEWSAHLFAGWYHGGEKVTDTLPPADESGYIVLRSSWDPCSVTYFGYEFQSAANLDGMVRIHSGVEKGGKTFNGWNTAEDGSGDWYLPGETYPLPEPITLYAQYLDTPPDGSWVITATNDGAGLYRALDTAPASGSKVTVTMPESETGWIYSTEASIGGNYYDTFGYCGGKTYEVSPRLKLREYAGGTMFHGGGGTFDNGSDFRSVILGGTSWTTLRTYPAAEDFETSPEGKVLLGWTRENSTTIYEPGSTFSGSAGNYHALWDSADAVYVIFSDVRGGTDYSAAVRSSAGEVITVPTANRPGYKLDGWSDGTTTWVPGAEYTVPEGGATLTAVWSEHIVLIVDGVEYAPEGSYNFGSPEDGGWKYDGSGSRKYLYLYDYSGKEIYLPDSSTVYISGVNTVTGSEGKPAISGDDYITVLRDNSADAETYSITLTGGSGAPAAQFYSFTLDSGIEATLTGGSGAPAVQVGYTVSLNTGHAVLTGGSGAPAIKTTSSYHNGLAVNNSYAIVLAGDSPETAAEIEDENYTDEHCVITQPKLYTLTINANGGKVEGRSALKLQAEYNQKAANMDELQVWHPNGSRLIGWYDAEGRAQNYNVWLYGDVELTARWNENPYDRYVYLDTRYEGSVNGCEGGAFIELPESGTVRLPEPEFNENYAERNFSYWFIQTDYSFVPYPANCDIPVEWLENGAVLRPNWNSGQSGSEIFIHPNGTGFCSEQGFCRRWLNGGSDTIESWWCRDNVDGLVIESLNTKADGSGIRYDIGDTVTVSPGETLVLYAQWKPDLPCYVTTRNNDTLPNRWSNEEYNSYGYIDGIIDMDHYLATLKGWRTADGSRIYFCGQQCDLPAGTILYAYYGDFRQDAAIRLYGNGADGPAPLVFSNTRRMGENNTEIYSTTEYIFFTRAGYELIGWNTKADGSGTFYEADARFHVGYSDANGNNWQMDEDLLAKLPKELYAQWRKLPTAFIPVPADMKAQENAVIYAAIYDESGRFIEIIEVEAGSDYVGIYEDFTDYSFFCLADDGSELPLTTHESG